MVSRTWWEGQAQTRRAQEPSLTHRRCWHSPSPEHSSPGSFPVVHANSGLLQIYPEKGWLTEGVGHFFLISPLQFGRLAAGIGGSAGEGQVAGVGFPAAIDFLLPPPPRAPAAALHKSKGSCLTWCQESKVGRTWPWPCGLAAQR